MKPLPLLPGVVADAVISPDGVYRYLLSRQWNDPPGPGRGVLWVMLNPSTASADEDDATLRKIQRFTRAWGYDGLCVVNLFALRSRDPKALVHHPDPIGPLNDGSIEAAVHDASTALVVVAWGSDGALHNRGLIVLERLAKWGVEPHRLGPATKGGHPWHPLYLPDDTALEPST